MNPSALYGELVGLPAVEALASEAAGRPAHLVGGVLRDRLLGRESHDLDAVVAGGGEELAERLAARLGARLVRLGGDRFAAFRLVAGRLTLDLWDRAPASLADDLARRDFTIDAFALDLASGELVDPFGGVGDLARRRLRATTAASFRDDPLRVLRLARLAAELPGFTADGATIALARAAATDLPRMAAERIREELLRLFGAPGALAGARLLAATRVYPGLWLGQVGQEAPATRFLELLAALEDGPPAFDERAARLTLSFLGLPPPADPNRALARFQEAGYLSSREAAAVRVLAATSDPPTETVGQRRFLHRAGELWPTAVAVVSARCRAELDPAWLAEPRERLLALARSDGEAILRPPRLLTGEEGQALLGLAPGPGLGRALEALRQAQVDGMVATREEAVRFLLDHAPRPT